MLASEWAELVIFRPAVDDKFSKAARGSTLRGQRCLGPFRHGPVPYAAMGEEGTFLTLSVRKSIHRDKPTYTDNKSSVWAVNPLRI